MVYITRAFISVCIFSVVVCALPFSVGAAEPNLRITEFMYNAEGSDKGKEYIEIINAGPGEVSVSDIKFSEHGRSHGLSVASGSGVLHPGDVAVIVGQPDLFAEHYSFKGTVLDSANYALNNTASTIILLLKGQAVHTVSYTKGEGANGDGNSLHISGSGRITARARSIGRVSGVAITMSSAKKKSEPMSGGGSSSTSGGGAQPEVKVPQMEVMPIMLIAEPEHIFLGSETVFRVERTEMKKRGSRVVESKEVLYGLWNFGDGTHTYGDSVRHAYSHLGDYIISFTETGRRGAVLSDPVRFKKEVGVISPRVRVERVDGSFVRVHNDHPFVLDVSGWQLFTHSIIFTFPTGSFISVGKSTVVPFSVSEGVDIFIVTAGGGQFSGRPKPEVVEVKGGEGVKEAAAPVVVREDAPVQEPKVVVKQEKEGVPVQTGEMGAGVGAAGEVEGQVPEVRERKEKGDNRMFIVWVALLLGVIAIAIAPLLIVRAEERAKGAAKGKSKKKGGKKKKKEVEVPEEVMLEEVPEDMVPEEMPEMVPDEMLGEVPEDMIPEEMPDEVVAKKKNKKKRKK